VVTVATSGEPSTMGPDALDDRPFFSRQERLPTVSSTNDVIRDWLRADTAEVCLAVADEQTAGRGRLGRSWVAPAGGALLCSLGFRPAWLAPDLSWRLAAVVALAMAEAAEEVAGLPDRSIGLKWPNDLVVEDAGPADPRAGSLRKLAGVLGETDGLGSTDPRAIVGIGINAGWPAADFPADLAGSMTSLHEASGGRPIDLAVLLDAFRGRLEPRVVALRSGRFDAGDWTARQVTTGRDVRLEAADGSSSVVRALGVDPRSGALVVADPTTSSGERSVVSGEVVHVRLAATQDGV
jgi:BirA family transcriptional regulator, biotin operon repressor / biotin---[acetyl-CoA-carboxylase] ligase